MDEKYEVSCMGIVISDNNKVLLLNCHGEWVFPKGHIENDETNVQTAIREVFEEAGVVLDEKQCVGKVGECDYVFYQNGKIHKHVYCYLFKVTGELNIVYQKEENFIDGKWFTFQEALERLFHDTSINLLKKAIKML